MVLKIRQNDVWVNLDPNETAVIKLTTNEALSARDPVIVNTDGTISKVSDSGSGTNLTATNFLGFSESAYAANTIARINITGYVDSNRSGLTAGETYYVQTDGTISTTADTPLVKAGLALNSTTLLVRN